MLQPARPADHRTDTLNAPPRPDRIPTQSGNLGCCCWPFRVPQVCIARRMHVVPVRPQWQSAHFAVRQCQDQKAVKRRLVQCFQLELNFGSGKTLRHARMHGTGGPWACWESPCCPASRLPGGASKPKTALRIRSGACWIFGEPGSKKEDLNAIVSYRENLMPRFLGVAAAEASTSRSVSASSCGRWSPVARILNVCPSRSDEEANLKQLAPGGFRVDRMRTIAHTLHYSQSYHAFADGVRHGVYSDNVTHPAYRPIQLIFFLLSTILSPFTPTQGICFIGPAQLPAHHLHGPRTSTAATTAPTVSTVAGHRPFHPPQLCNAAGQPDL